MPQAEPKKKKSQGFFLMNVEEQLFKSSSKALSFCDLYKKAFVEKGSNGLWGKLVVNQGEVEEELPVSLMMIVCLW